MAWKTIDVREWERGEGSTDMESQRPKKTLAQIDAGRVAVIVRETAMGRSMVVIDNHDANTLRETTIVATSRPGALALADAIRELADLLALPDKSQKGEG